MLRADKLFPGGEAAYSALWSIYINLGSSHECSNQDMSGEAEPATPSRSRRSLFWWIRTAALVLAVVAVAIVAFVIYRAEPILRGRVMETLSLRFRGHV